MLCDQAWPLPAMVNAGCPYAFICSAQPGVLQLNGFPKIMSDASPNDPNSIKKFDDEMAAFWSDIRDYMHEFYKKRNSTYERNDFQINHIRSDAFIIYSFPKVNRFLPVAHWPFRLLYKILLLNMICQIISPEILSKGARLSGR